GEEVLSTDESAIRLGRRIGERSRPPGGYLASGFSDSRPAIGGKLRGLEIRYRISRRTAFDADDLQPCRGQFLAHHRAGHADADGDDIHGPETFRHVVAVLCLRQVGRDGWVNVDMPMDGFRQTHRGPTHADAVL